jgi:hypothetical protein
MITEQAPGQTIGHFDATNALEVTTVAVSEDELCFMLMEANMLEATGHTRVRYQLLRVVRNDRLVTAYVPLGPAQAFTANQLCIRGGAVEPNGRGWAVNTVGELREIADEMRASQSPQQEAPDLESAYQDQSYQMSRFRKRESTFGYGGNLIRSFDL